MTTQESKSPAAELDLTNKIQSIRVVFEALIKADGRRIQGQLKDAVDIINFARQFGNVTIFIDHGNGVVEISVAYTGYSRGENFFTVSIA